jgi:ribose 5-phosphate isomerase RpiB
LGRLVATAGIIGIGVGLGALLASNKVQGWIIGLVVAAVSVVLTTLLRRS